MLFFGSKLSNPCPSLLYLSSILPRITGLWCILKIPAAAGGAGERFSLNSILILPENLLSLHKCFKASLRTWRGACFHTPWVTFPFLWINTCYGITILRDCPVAASPSGCWWTKQGLAAESFKKKQLLPKRKEVIKGYRPPVTPLWPCCDFRALSLDVFLSCLPGVPLMTQKGRINKDWEVSGLNSAATDVTLPLGRPWARILILGGVTLFSCHSWRQ